MNIGILGLIFAIALTLAVEAIVMHLKGVQKVAKLRAAFAAGLIFPLMFFYSNDSDRANLFGFVFLFAIAAVGAIIGTIALAPNSAQAGEAPWCAIYPLGAADVVEECRFWSIEQCRPSVIAGNRGFCGQNPRWQGPWPPMKKRTRRIRR